MSTNILHLLSCDIREENILFYSCKLKINRNLKKRFLLVGLGHVTIPFLWPDSPGAKSGKSNETFAVRVKGGNKLLKEKES